MRYSVVCICVILTFTFLLSFSVSMDEPKGARPTGIPRVDVLILHDSLPGPLPPGLLDSNNILDLLGHFGMKGSISSIESYKKNDLQRYRFVIMLGVDNRKIPLPPALVADLRASALPVFLIGNHLPELTADAQFLTRIGFRISGPGITQGFTTVSYKGTALTKGDPSISPVEILNPAIAKVMATAQSTDGKTLPYMINAGSFWYCADSPFGFADEGDRYLVLCDILHDFFKVMHPEERNALVRLEDISVEDDPQILRKYADYFYERKIPFQISLIPIFVNPEDKSEIYLSDRPEFVRAIRYMVSKGGAVVMHGVTHQYGGKSSDDYEFWDELADRPVSGDSRAFVEKKLRLGLEECFKNGIYPLTWETPHYGASELDYRTIAEYFSSAYDRTLSVDRAESGHYFPYPSVDRFGRYIIPENLGYIPQEEPDPEVLIKNCERLKAVRDGIASFFFHTFLDIHYLERCIDGIEALGYHFISIRDFDLRVQMDSRLVQTYTDSIQLPMNGLYLHRFLLDDFGRRSGESYTAKRQTGIFRDPGIVPANNSVLVIEGVPEIIPQTEPQSPGMWSTVWAWLQKRFELKNPITRTLNQPQAVVLWDDSLVRAEWNDQASFASAFSDFGFRVSNLNYKNYSSSSASPGTVLAIPLAVASKLSAKQNQLIADYVQSGGSVIIDGPSPLSELLGVRSEKRSLRVRQVVSEATWLGKQRPDSVKRRQQLTWNPPANVFRFSTRNPVAVFAEDKDSEMPVAVLAQHGQGRFLYLGARLDPVTGLGYTRFPYLIHWAMEGFDLKLPLKQGQLEMYFDPGDRQAIDIERLANEWRMRGVRAIYAAAYQFWPTWSYDYQRLIDVCHKNGILVYAWLELPHVSVKFWEDHPEWRAKTATGEDGHVGWRYHMDLDIPACQDAAYDFVENLLNQYPWDGVNIAELNYDTLKGPEDPKTYLPMGKTTREAFKALGGFDPILLFAPESPYWWEESPAAIKKFNDYRAQRVLAWHRSLLERITPLAQKKDMEIIVTMMDSLHSPTLTRDTGVDSHLIVSLMDQFPFTLQVEDPAHFWTESPNRYKQFTKTYLKLVRDRKRLMFDINIVDRDLRYSNSPTARAAGIELARMFIQASEASGRVGVYSESTISQEDMQTLASVLARNAKLDTRWNSWETKSDGTILVSAPGMWQDFKVDNILWPGWGDNEVLVLKGRHQITPVERKFRLFDTSILDIRLLRFTGNIDSLTPTDRGFQFTYESNGRSLALFNKHPFGVLVDGQANKDPVLAHSGLWSVRLPHGQHQVDIMADSTAIVILEKTSLYGSTLIVVFGTVACGLMLLIYFAILARRAVGRAVSGKTPSVSSRQP
jgi:uncharacterized protein YdaL